MKLFAILAALLLLGANAYAQTSPVDISKWPIPTTGSTQLSSGDSVVATRSGISYKLNAGFGGTCLTSQWVNSITPQGVPSCIQPTFSNLGGYLALSQLAGTYTNGQLLIGNGTSGKLQAGSLTAGSNITIGTSAGGITVGLGTSVMSLAHVSIGTSATSYPLQVIGTASASSYFAGGTQGVTCSGSPTSSFASVNGIVTHC